MRYLISIIIVLLLAVLQSAAVKNPGETLLSGRELYYESVEDEDKIDPSIEKFEKLIKEKPKLEGLSLTYIGSLTMLKAKHEFWPLKKLEYVEEGIIIMDKGIKKDPDNIESLFIYGSTCWYLPKLLGKRDLAIEKLNAIIPLLNDRIFENYEAKIIEDALAFLKENLELSKTELSKVNKYYSRAVEIGKPAQ